MHTITITNPILGEIDHDRVTVHDIEGKVSFDSKTGENIVITHINSDPGHLDKVEFLSEEYYIPCTCGLDPGDYYLEQLSDESIELFIGYNSNMEPITEKICSELFDL